MSMAQAGKNSLAPEERNVLFTKANISLLRSSRLLWDSGFYKHWIPPGPKSTAVPRLIRCENLETTLTERHFCPSLNKVLQANWRQQPGGSPLAVSQIIRR